MRVRSRQAGASHTGSYRLQEDWILFQVPWEVPGGALPTGGAQCNLQSRRGTLGAVWGKRGNSQASLMAMASIQG